MRVIFSDRAYASVLAETAEKVATETGGAFLGTVIDDTWYVIEAIDPGPKSVFEVAYFEYDQEYTQHLINKIARLYDKQLSLIGLWHRHPGSMDFFSSTDGGTNSKYASMREEGAISALVNIDPTFRLTVYHVSSPCRYKKIPYEVGNRLIPNELLAYKSPERFCSIMDEALHPAEPKGYHRSASLDSFMKLILPQLKDDEIPENSSGELAVPDGEFIPPSVEDVKERLINEVVEDLTFMSDDLGIEATASFADTGLALRQEAIDKATELCFEYAAPDGKFILCFDGKRYAYQSGAIAKAFEKVRLEREREKADKNPAGVIGSVIKIIRFNRNEE